MRAAVLLFPGLNRESDAMRALQQASGVKPSLVWHSDTDLPKGTDLVVIPGGFSYGDDIAAGRIMGALMRRGLRAALAAAVERADLGPFERLHAALALPFEERAQDADLRAAPPPADAPYRTFCGT